MNNVTVIGAGTMGNGIAHVFAQFGYQVNLADQSPDLLKTAITTITSNLERQIKKGIIGEEEKFNILGRIRTFNSVESAASSADLVVEAVTENFEVKAQLFKELDSCTPGHCILASNTSSISLTKIGAVTQRPEKVIGMHFMNPVPVMQLVEVIRGYATSDEVTNQVMDISRKLNKIPVEVNDYPGFVSNRILMPMINEAIYTLYEGVAGVEEIDTVMKLGMSHPMGPLQLADFIGLDVCLYILKVLYDGFGNPKYSPCPLLINMVEAGNKGMKTGTGFYTYKGKSKEAVVSERFIRR